MFTAGKKPDYNGFREEDMWSRINGLKPQRGLDIPAQGNALGIMRRDIQPCKGVT